MGSVHWPPASGCSCVPSAPWTRARSPRRVRLSPREASPAPVTGLSFTRGKFCFLELAWERAGKLPQAEHAVGHHTRGHFLRLLWDSNGIPESVSGSSLASECRRKGQIVSDSCSLKLLSPGRAAEGNDILPCGLLHGLTSTTLCHTLHRIAR